MFRTKRNTLVKRLWKYKAKDETKGAAQRDPSVSASMEDVDLKSVTHSFFKRLKEEQLGVLLQAMESRGGEITPCVPVSKSDVRLGKHSLSPYVLCCRVFRWPDLKGDTEMKRLPSCARLNEDSESVVCCNPYHWSLVVKIDEPPIYLDKLPGSSPAQIIDHNETSTDNEGTGQNFMYWCTVAYWELRERVGRLFQVSEPSVHVFQQLPHGNGVCLRLFQKPSSVEVVRRTREKIGFGIILSREAAHKNNVNIQGRVKEESGSHVTCNIQSGSPGSPDCPGQYKSSSTSSCIIPPSYLEDILLKESPVGGGSEGCDTSRGHHGDGNPQKLHPEHDPSHEFSDVEHSFDESMDFTQTTVMSPSSSPPPQWASQLQQSSSPSSFSSLSSSPPSSPPSYFNSDTSFNSQEILSSNHEPRYPPHPSSQGTNKRKSPRHRPHPSTTATSDLPYKQGEVWAYNASNFPIFVNSPTLDHPQSPRSLVVKKVLPGYSIKIFDYARAELLERTEARSKLRSDGPFDPCSVRISLAKGWGPSYSRQFITSCPCWLEIFLGVRRRNSTS
ncbi:LOW QUALITY PROTEIN: mothers against decapentaplegic homolog 6-like [Physella acuta]|uniref:LOW QUALITY PROTEIN: mothers against decapentaplegic homolog 6-like n=1 Tax=Physella acuta TaxID=109671 RepID=UPI0027DE4BCD|nr:LOW QUALITY PROTEIN: mothers against decapentaplegic homolog 6-like [Physella acuta]